MLNIFSKNILNLQKNGFWKFKKHFGTIFGEGFCGFLICWIINLNSDKFYVWEFWIWIEKGLKPLRIQIDLE